MYKPQWGFALRRAGATLRAVCLAIALVGAAACGPQARIPPRPATLPGAVADSHPHALLTRGLAPVLYLQRDESFRLVRVVAVVHPTRPVIGYHLLWRDDAHGAWLPFTRPTDEEIVWVGYDSTGAPTDVWTYWHQNVLHADWRGRGTVLIDVQWGKHGSLPHDVVQSDLPRFRTLNSFYATQILFVWDFWLGRLSREGPLCFCRSARRYAEFTRPELLAPQLSAVVVAADPGPTLQRVFGTPYSEKPWWPWKPDLEDVKGVT